MKQWYADVLEQGPVVRAQVARALQEERGKQQDDHVGCVVEFLRGGRHRCGVVRTPPARTRSLWVLDQEDREIWVSFRKIVDISTDKLTWHSRHETVHTLRQIDRARREIQETMDIRPLWEVAVEEPDKEWAINELADLFFDAATDSDHRAALTRCLDSGAYFSGPLNYYRPRQIDAVERRGEVHGRRQQVDTELQAVADWLRQVADANWGTESDELLAPGRAPLPPANLPSAAVADAIELLEEAALYGGERTGTNTSFRYPSTRNEPDRHRAHKAAELMKRVHLHGPLAAFDVLVRLGHWDVDENLELRRCGVPVDFSRETIDEAARSLESGYRRERGVGRWWGRRAYAFSEDAGAGQAFSVRRTLSGYMIGIHFADPQSLIDPQGNIQREGTERGMTVELADRTIPMIPAVVGTNCQFEDSRLRRDRRVALTVAVRFDASWRMLDYDLSLRRVSPRLWLTMAAVEGGLSADRWLGRLHQLALTLRKRRRDGGELVFAEPEVVVKAGNSVVVDQVDPLQPGTLIANELVLLAQDLAARFCRQKGLAAIYRVGSVASERLIDSDRFEPATVHAQRKLMSRPSLQASLPAAERARLAVGRPLDRIEDLLVHQQLSRFLTTGEPAYSAAELQRSLDDTRWARDAAAAATRWSRRYWILKWLERWVGNSLDAVVLERAGPGLLVELTGCRLKVFIRGGRESWASPGDAIRADLARVSARRDEVELVHPRPLNREQAGASTHDGVGKHDGVLKHGGVEPDQGGDR